MKVTLRELLGKQPKFYLYRTDDKTTIINAYKSLDKYIGELTAEVKAFLEPSPQTREIQKLLENLREKIAEALKYASLPKKKAVSALLDEALPKLEAFLENVDKTLQSKDLAYKTMEAGYIHLSKDHVSQEKLENLIEDFPEKKPIYDVWDENNPDDFDYEKEEIDEWRIRLELLTEKGGE